MKFYKMGITILLIPLCLTACKGKEVVDANIEAVEVEEMIVEEPEKPVKEGLPSPLSGIYTSEENIKKRVVGIMFDNHPKARWQAGLKDAELIYEFEVEAPYTRYLGFYLINEPDNLGPIRSARPYFITKTLEYDSLYVHVGGSEAAKDDVRNLGIPDIDGLSCSAKVFWRKSHKKMPNNLYTSMEAIRTTAKERNYRESGESASFLFYEDDTDIKGDIAKDIRINYNNNNNSTGYIYNEEEKVYHRYKDGEKHIDEDDASSITAKNIIIQEVNTRTIDNIGRISVDLVGNGKGRYFSNGIGTEIKWVKDARNDKTIYYNENGQEIYLNTGVTWIQMIRPTTEVIVN